MNNIIIRKFRKVENLGPIVLLITQETPEILLQRLVCSCRLPIGLRMVAEGEVTSDLEHFKEVLPEFRDELGSTVADDTIGNSVCFIRFKRRAMENWMYLKMQRKIKAERDIINLVGNMERTESSIIQLLT